METDAIMIGTLDDAVDALAFRVTAQVRDEAAIVWVNAEGSVYCSPCGTEKTRSGTTLSACTTPRSRMRTSSATSRHSSPIERGSVRGTDRRQLRGYLLDVRGRESGPGANRGQV